MPQVIEAVDPELLIEANNIVAKIKACRRLDRRPR
jgi:hypothetical protein